MDRYEIALGKPIFKEEEEQLTDARFLPGAVTGSVTFNISDDANIPECFRQWARVTTGTGVIIG